MPAVPKNIPKPLPQFPLPIGSRIAELRKSLGYSQHALGEALGLSQKQITDYETGRVHMNDEMIVRFALALNASADYLLGISEKETSGKSLSLRFTRRMRELDSLPEIKKKAILQVLDDLIRANS